MRNQILFDKLLITTDDNVQHRVDATSATPFDIIYNPDTRALVHDARHAQPITIPDSMGQTKEPTETGGLPWTSCPTISLLLSKVHARASWWR